MIFIERIIYSILKDAVEEIQYKRQLLLQFLLDGGLSEDEAKEAVTHFLAHPPDVVHGYARRDTSFPCWAIVLGGEANDADYLGEDASCLDDDGELELDDDGNPVDLHVRRFNHQFDVYIYADHPDVTLYHYHLCKQLLMESRSLLQAHDLDEITFSGADMAPDPRYLPAELFVRRFGISLKSDEVYVERFRPGVGLGRKVDGTFVDDGSDVPEAEGEDEPAAAGITTYTES